jgi:hypothetical protein
VTVLSHGLQDEVPVLELEPVEQAEETEGEVRVRHQAGRGNQDFEGMSVAGPLEPEDPREHETPDRRVGGQVQRDRPGRCARPLPVAAVRDSSHMSLEALFGRREEGP